MPKKWSNLFVPTIHHLIFSIYFTIFLSFLYFWKSTATIFFSISVQTSSTLHKITMQHRWHLVKIMMYDLAVRKLYIRYKLTACMRHNNTGIGPLIDESMTGFVPISCICNINNYNHFAVIWNIHKLYHNKSSLTMDHILL